MVVACDGICQKAWGVSQRPNHQLSDDIDDVVFLADEEFPIAPIDPGTYEGGYAKPISPDDMLWGEAFSSIKKSIISSLLIVEI